MLAASPQLGFLRANDLQSVLMPEADPCPEEVSTALSVEIIGTLILTSTHHFKVCKARHHLT